MIEKIKRKSIPDLICEKVLQIVGQTKEISELEKKKLAYYVYALYVNITKIIVLLTVALVLNIFWEVIIIWGFFALLRRVAFGIHSSNSFYCTIATVLTFVVGGLISKYLYLPSYVIYTVYLLSFIAYIIYAPADTESRPLVGKNLRKKLKIKTISTFVVLFVVAMISNLYLIKILFAVSALAEAISILPITYKIFKRRYKNYEYFKKSGK